MLESFETDCQAVVQDSNIPFGELQNKTILITGATGLIGQMLVRALCYFQKTVDVTVIAVVRNPQKAETMFSDLLGSHKLMLCVGDIMQPLAVEEPVDYIIHAASQTSSKGFVDTPVETIHTSLIGTENLLKLAQKKQVASFVYLSTMEVYGTPGANEKIDETHVSSLNTMAVRSCYPESKRMCENLCVSYYSEYGVPTSVVRLTQTFGPGVVYNDGRVFAEFARCAVEKRDIILHTTGETERNYLYIADAVRAILTVMLKAPAGEAYNAANEATYCSILEMAKLVADRIANGAISVWVEMETDIQKFGYAPALHMNLNTSKLKALGWQPSVDLEESFKRMIAYWEEQFH